MTRVRCTIVSGLRQASALAVLLAAGLAAPAASAAEPMHFHHENILGTSLDVEVATVDAKLGAAVEAAVLGEIERLRKILSTYDPSSEISRLNSATAPLVCSPEMIDVLSAYDLWQARSHGAYNGHLGDLIGLWSKAEKAGIPPSAADLQAVLAELPRPGWKINSATRSVTRLTASHTLNVNSLGKGYIVTKAAVAARKAVPGVKGFLVNIGGDIFASGQPSADSLWSIGVADPRHSEENAAPLTKVRLANQAVSTSAAYERGYTLKGRHFSHILDPRSGQPAQGVSSATVIANNNASANAMATALCVLKPEEGLELVKTYPGAACLIIGADGQQFRSEGFAALEGAAPSPPTPGTAPALTGAWPLGYQVSMAIDIKPSAREGRKSKRPFVAIWVDNASGQRVRTVTVWGNERKYLPELRAWWKEAKADPDKVAAITRATRSVGQYRIVWDGKDERGQALPLGTYTISVEANREHGSYSLEHGEIVCGKVPATGSIPAAAEFGETKLSYGPAPP